LLVYAIYYILFLLAAAVVFNGVISSASGKKIFLITLSYIFCFWINPFTPFVLLLTTASGYHYGAAIFKAPSEELKKRKLKFSLFFNLSILITFRYLGDIFDILNFAGLSRFAYGHENIISAVGVSFFVFQNISYILDCYLETIEPSNNFTDYALYMAFFPKLIQGPIERFSAFSAQFAFNGSIGYNDMRDGLFLIMTGILKKVVIADNIAVFVSGATGNIDQQSGFFLLLSIYCYSLQIYFDFSGYTDMAIGSARLFGIKLTNNFNNPYLAVSIQDFWKRWHISLSSWILDYIFKPMQMELRDYGNKGLFASLMTTFIICGAWHGLTVNFIVWGAFHGAALCVSYITYKKWMKFCKKSNIPAKLVTAIDVFVTFNLVSFSWLIFSLKNPSDVMKILNKIYAEIANRAFGISFANFPISKKVIVIAAVFLLLEFISERYDIKKFFFERNIALRWLCYYFITFLVFNYGSGSIQFIYAQF